MAKKERSLDDLVILALMRFEEDLYRLMDLMDMNRAALASATGCSRANISQLLNGDSKNPQLRTLAKLARALNSRIQVRMVRDGHEVVRVMDIETAESFDDAQIQEADISDLDEQSVRVAAASGGNLLPFPGLNFKASSVTSSSMGTAHHG